MSKVSRFAIVTTVLPKKQDGKGNYRPTYGFRMMAMEAQRLGMQAVLVHPDHFDWKKKCMNGWIGEKIGTPNERWVKQKVPLPEVVYDNVFVHLVLQGKTKMVREKCKLHHIPLFNPICPGKYTVNKILNQTELKRYVPETKVLRQPSDVLNMLEKYKTVYVKPSGGYGGQGVSRISRLNNGSFRVQMDRNAGKVVAFNKVMNSQQISHWLQLKRRVPHVVQQGIQLIQVDGGNVDFRVVVQRGEQGEWRLIGIVPKIAKRDGVVTNLVAGGRKTSLASLVKFVEQNGQVLPVHLLETAAVEIASFWSKRLPTLGILGFDMGMDANGKPWLIEMNPKPARSLLTSDMRRKTFAAVAEFAYYLAERKQKQFTSKEKTLSQKFQLSFTDNHDILGNVVETNGENNTEN